MRIQPRIASTSSTMRSTFPREARAYAPNTAWTSSGRSASSSHLPCTDSMTFGPDRPIRALVSSAVQSAAQARIDDPPNTSPTAIVSTGTPAMRASNSARKARASASSAAFASCRRTPPEARRTTIAAGRSCCARTNSARNASPWFAPTLPRRKRSSCAAIITGAPATSMRAVATPSSSCAASPNRSR